MKRNIIIIFFIILTLSVLVLVTRSNQDTRSKAAFIAPTSTLLPPSLRLATTEQAFDSGQPIPIHVLVNTNGRPTVEAYIILRFDNQVLSIGPEDIQRADVYPVVNIESAGQGKLALSLFTTLEAGYAPIETREEVEIATAVFHAKKAGQTTISVEQESGLFTLRDKDSGQSDNILISTDGVTIKIN